MTNKMVKYLFRHDKNYSRFNIIKQLLSDFECKNDIFILMPFSKNQFIKHFFRRKRIVNDFFISNYDTYVYDRQKITKFNPRAWLKFVQDYINFKFSKYLISDTQEHFLYWQKLFGKFNGKHFVLPVLADTSIYFPNEKYKIGQKVKILFYGSFIPLHGIDKILHAFKILEENGVNFEAQIIGNGQMFKKFHRLFLDLNLKSVTMNGEFINEKELAKIIGTSDIILGVFGNSQKAKSVVPNKVYQGMACKKAVVTMKDKPVYEFFDDSEILTCENSAEILAQNLKNLCENPEKIENLANNGYKKFCKLYKNTKENFREFLKQIDSEISKEEE